MDDAEDVISISWSAEQHVWVAIWPLREGLTAHYSTFGPTPDAALAEMEVVQRLVREEEAPDE